MTTSNITTLPRKSTEWVKPEELRTLLKNNLGLNARKATVKGGSSHRYLTIVIRDASVNIASVKAFAKTLHTWNMDETDYVSGQSISVEVTEEVRKAHAAPWKEAAAVIASKLGYEDGSPVYHGSLALTEIAPDVTLHLSTNGWCWLEKGTAESQRFDACSTRQSWFVDSLASIIGALVA